MKRLMSAVLGVVFLLALASCSSGSGGANVGTCAAFYAALGYKPPFVPLTFKIDTSGAISLEFSHQINTPIGAFSIEGGVSQDEPGSTVLDIRHLKNGNTVEDAYRICQDKVVVTLNGQTRVETSNGRVFIDATKGTVTSIEIGQGPANPSPEPSSSDRPVVYRHIATLVVPATSANGLRYQALTSGTYRFTYVDGAYAVWPGDGRDPSGKGFWLSAIFFFRGSRVPFDGEIIRKSDSFLNLADYGYWDDRVAAIDTAKQSPDQQTAELSAGDLISLAAVDSADYYADNPGSVTVDVSILVS